ncbi:MAG: hypothetical protein ACK4HV_07510 [Parachlamydiaceae bacterium]
MHKLFFPLLMLTLNLSALLPPLYESIHQFQAIVNDPKLSDNFQSGEAILSIEQNKDGLFLVKTNQHTLEVKVESIPLTMPGPGKYKVYFGTLK